jgi:hypothetical protein
MIPTPLFQKKSLRGYPQLLGRLTFSIDGHHGFRFASPVATGPRPIRIRGAANFRTLRGNSATSGTSST